MASARLEAADCGPVLFAYDGSDLAAFAIAQAAAHLPARRDALVVCVWQPVEVGFAPTDGRHFNADRATEVRNAAEQTAAHGARWPARRDSWPVATPGSRSRRKRCRQRRLSF